MENTQIFEMADRLKTLQEQKKDLEAQTKALGAEIAELDEQISDAMTEAELDRSSRNGSTFYLKSRLFASPASGRKDEMMQALKGNGYGSLVVETVNANTLAAFIKEQREATDDCQGLEFSFDRVKLPAGGGTAFEIPSAESDESEMAKDITGVIVYNHPAYAYYHDKYTGGNNPPDCGSFDGVTGIGTPGGNCANCPYNKFGSGEGQSKLCKNKRMLYILREGELFPITLSLPTGSLNSFTNYVKSQLSRGRKLNQVVTKITLKKATNASGIAFSQAVF